MRILWIGDLAATGFGTVTSDTGRELISLGIDVRFVSQYGYDAPQEPFRSRALAMSVFDYNDEGITGVRDVLPRVMRGDTEGMTLANGEPWGDWMPDAAFLLGDFYGLREMALAVGLDSFRSVPTFHYAPIEGHDLPPKWNEVWDVIHPIAMSKFGQDEIEKVTGTRPPLVYHGVDADAFHPVSPSDPIILDGEDNGGERLVLSSKAMCKYALFGTPRIILALRCDRFMPRKGYDALIRSMAPVLRERPNMVLAIHCRERDYGGYLPDTISKYPDVADRILNPQFGPVPRSVLVAMYNAADVYVSTSAEGFGLTIAEAVACGVPAVGLDYSAVPEVIGPAGQVVPVGRYLDNEYAHHWALPDEESFGKAVGYLVDHPHKRVAMGAAGPGHVRRNFRWDTAASQFVDIARSAIGSDVSDTPELVAA